MARSVSKRFQFIINVFYGISHDVDVGVGILHAVVRQRLGNQALRHRGRNGHSEPPQVAARILNGLPRIVVDGTSARRAYLIRTAPPGGTQLFPVLVENLDAEFLFSWRI